MLFITCSAAATLIRSTQAATLSPGSLIKGTAFSSVYYYSSNGKRYVFSNEKTYKTWYADFSNVATISDEDLGRIPIGGNVTYRPGIRMVKIESSPQVYVVGRGGTLRWVTNEAVASALYGPDWNRKIEDIPDSYFANYIVGERLDSATDFSLTREKAEVTTIDLDKRIIAQAPQTAPSNPQAVSCVEDGWWCGEWQACSSNNVQSRSCAMQFDCPGISSPPPFMSQACTPSASSPRQSPPPSAPLSLFPSPSPTAPQTDTRRASFEGPDTLRSSIGRKMRTEIVVDTDTTRASSEDLAELIRLTNNILVYRTDTELDVINIRSLSFAGLRENICPGCSSSADGKLSTYYESLDSAPEFVILLRSDDVTSVNGGYAVAIQPRFAWKKHRL